MTWGMGVGDVAHKVAKIKDELGRGRKVDLVFARATGKGAGAGRKKERMTRDAMEERVGDVVNQVLEVGKEWKPREVRGGTVVVYLQGLATGVHEEKQKDREKVREHKADDVDDEEVFVGSS